MKFSWQSPKLFDEPGLFVSVRVRGRTRRVCVIPWFKDPQK